MEKETVQGLCKIRDLQRAIARFETAFIEQFGLTLNEGMLLCTLQEHTRLTAGELSDALGLTASNTSKVIRPVERQGLITRLVDENDKRRMVFTLTRQGKERIKAIKKATYDWPELLKQAIGEAAH